MKNSTAVRLALSEDLNGENVGVALDCVMGGLDVVGSIPILGSAAKILRGVIGATRRHYKVCNDVKCAIGRILDVQERLSVIGSAAAKLSKEARKRLESKVGNLNDLLLMFQKVIGFLPRKY